MDWSDLPVVYDAPYYCEHCSTKEKVQHHCVAYKDIEYRTCLHCGAKSEHLPEKKRKLIVVRTKKDDRTKKRDDDHRNFPHRKNERKNKDE